jgi:hypothetical protein
MTTLRTNENLSEVVSSDKPSCEITKIPRLTLPHGSRLVLPVLRSCIIGIVIGAVCGALFMTLLGRPVLVHFAIVRIPESELPFPQMEITCAIFGALAGASFLGIRRYQKKFLELLLQPYSTGSQDDRAFALVACVLSKKDFIRFHGIEQLAILDSQALSALPELFALHASSEHQASPAVACAILGISPSNTEVQGSLLKQLTYDTPVSFQNACATAACLKVLGAKAEFSLQKLTNVSKHITPDYPNRILFESAAQAIAKAVCERDAANMAHDTSKESDTFEA